MAEDQPIHSPVRKKSKIPIPSTSATDEADGFVAAPKRLTRRSFRSSQIEVPDLPTQNVFNILSDSEDSMEEEEPEKPNEARKMITIRRNPCKTSKKPPKPIIAVNTTLDALKTTIKPLGLTVSPTFIKRSGPDFAIHAANTDDKKKIIEKLTLVNQQHFTFTENSDRHLIFALLGHHNVSIEELLAELVAANIPAVKVIKANRSEENPIFLVSFKKDSVTLKELQSKHSTIDFLKVKWEKHRPRSRRPTQCRRCQRFGHAASNCSLPYRCMKCLDAHEPGMCARTSREVGQPSCVNCKTEGHASNSIHCPAYVKYTQSIAAKKTRRLEREPRPFPATRYDWSQQRSVTENAHLAASQPPPCTSFSQPIVNRTNREYRPSLTNSAFRDAPSNDNLFSQLASIQEDIMSLPDMKKTIELYKMLLEDLKKAKSHAERLSVLLMHAEMNSQPFSIQP
jgi:hypothetical protein